MNIREAKTKKITWDWTKRVFKIRACVETTYKCHDWKIVKEVDSYYDRWTRTTQRRVHICIYNKKEEIKNISTMYGNVFTHISQIKKYVEYIVSKRR